MAVIKLKYLIDPSTVAKDNVVNCSISEGCHPQCKGGIAQMVEAVVEKGSGQASSPLISLCFFLESFKKGCSSCQFFFQFVCLVRTYDNRKGRGCSSRDVE